MQTELKPVAWLYREAMRCGDAIERQQLDHSWLKADAKNQHDYIKGEPLYLARLLKIELDDKAGYAVSLTDSDGDMRQLGDHFDHPYAAVDWCERNGFAWEVIGAVGDPVAALAAWRAEQ